MDDLCAEKLKRQKESLHNLRRDINLLIGKRLPVRISSFLLSFLFQRSLSSKRASARTRKGRKTTSSPL